MNKITTDLIQLMKMLRPLGFTEGGRTDGVMEGVMEGASRMEAINHNRGYIFGCVLLTGRVRKRRGETDGGEKKGSLKRGG